MATLTLDNLSKRFGRDIWGVRQLDLAVADHEFIVLLGPSGCGKSTTIRLIAGLEEPTAGTIRIGEEDVTRLPPRRRGVSMVFQSYAVWPHMTVFENIAFALRLKQWPAADVDAAVREVAGLTQIGDLLARHPHQLSGGQQQRVALARALAVKPEVFLMDEPLSNLDAKLRAAMRTELKTIHQATQATSLYVTHDQSEAMSMADRIVVMREGEVVQVGTPEEVYFQSANTFVASFIGMPPTNFLDVEIVREADAVSLVHPRFRLPLDAPQAARLAAYGRRALTLGVRPEDLLLVDAEEAVLTETVQVAEPQGSHQVVSADLAGTLLKIVAPAQPTLHAGDPLPLTVRTERLQFFDSESGERLRQA